MSGLSHVSLVTGFVLLRFFFFYSLDPKKSNEVSCLTIGRQSQRKGSMELKCWNSIINPASGSSENAG